MSRFMDPREQMKFLSSVLPPPTDHPQVTDPELFGSLFWKHPLDTCFQQGPARSRGDKDTRRLHHGLKEPRMVGERWVNVSSPYNDSRLAMVGVWGLPKLRKQGGLLRGGNA